MTSFWHNSIRHRYSVNMLIWLTSLLGSLFYSTYGQLDAGVGLRGSTRPN